MWPHVTTVWGREPAGVNGACNAAHYEAGPLTIVSAPVLIITAVYAIQIHSRICSSWLSAAQTKNERLMSVGV
jgi:hypothetical protein